MNERPIHRASHGQAEGSPPRCSNCHDDNEDNFEWGWVRHIGYGSYLRYSPLNKFSLWGGFSHRVLSRRCLKCNQISFFYDPKPVARFGLRALFIATTVLA